MAREQEALQDAVRNDLNKRRRLEELEERSKSELKDVEPDYRQTRVSMRLLLKFDILGWTLRVYQRFKKALINPIVGKFFDLFIAYS